MHAAIVTQRNGRLRFPSSMLSNPTFFFIPVHGLRRRWCACAWLAAGLTAALVAAESVRRTFDIPAGRAERSLRQYSAQAGVQLVYPTAVVRDVQTRAVKGRYTDREALEHMFASTPLRVVRDEKTGALTLTRPTPAAPEGNKAATR